MEKENNHFLSVDVEDWYHSEYLRHFAKEKVPRIEKTIPLLLDILRKHNTTITFFTLGDIADKRNKCKWARSSLSLLFPYSTMEPKQKNI